MAKDLDIEDAVAPHPLAREQLTALLKDNARLRAENEALKADVSDLLRYLPARVVAAWRDDKPATAERIDATLRGEGG